MAHNGRSSKRSSKQWYIRGGVLAAVGIALAGASMPAAAAGAPSLGAARSFAVLGAANVASTGNTVVTGDVGVSPGTEISGFPPAIVAGGFAIHATDTLANQAHADAATAYGVLAGMASLPANNLSNTDLGGRTLAPAVYKFDGAAQLTGALVLDAGGDSSALFVIQVASALTTASGATVTVINGGTDYDESNIFWQVGSSATLGLGTSFTGNILASASITLDTGSTMVGNALALNGAVTLDNNAVNSPTLVVAPPVGIAAPVALTAVLTGTPASQGADLSWTDGSDNETEFRVYRKDGAAPGFNLVGTVLATDMAGTTAVLTFQDTDLVRSRIFVYRVTAFNAADGESDPSNTDQVHTGPGVPAARPSGAKVTLTPPEGAEDDDAVARLNIKYFPVNHGRPARSWFKLKLRHLAAGTEYSLWTDDPSTAGAELVQFDTITTKNSGNYNYMMDTKKGGVLPFGATLADLAGTTLEIRNSAGTVVVLSGTIPNLNP